MYTCTSITITNKLRVLSKSSCPLVHVKKQESAASHTLILSTTECIENNTSTKACTTITDNSYQSCLHSTIKECTTITKHPPRNVLPQQSFADTRKQLSQPSPNTSYMQKYDILCLYVSYTGSTTASNTSSRPTNTEEPWSPASQKSQQSGAIMGRWVSSPTQRDRNKVVLRLRWSLLRVAFLSGVRDSMAGNNSVQKQYLHSYNNTLLDFYQASQLLDFKIHFHKRS